MDEENSAFKKLEGDMLWQYHGIEIRHMDNPATVGDIKKAVKTANEQKKSGKEANEQKKSEKEANEQKKPDTKGKN